MSSEDKRTNPPISADFPNFTDRLKGPAFWLVIILLGAMVGLALLKIINNYEIPFLIFTLNILFIGLPAVVITVFTTRSFLYSGVLPILWFGVGSVLYGIGALAGGLLLVIGTANEATTLSSILFLAGGAVHFLGSFFSTNEVSPFGNRSKRLSFLYQVYAGVLIFVVFVIIITASDRLPVFFFWGEGGTPLRQMIIGVTVVLFLLASFLYSRQYRATHSRLLYWYSLGLLLIGLGMIAFLLEVAPGTLLNWAGRISQLLGGLYLFVAAMVNLLEARAKKAPVAQTLASFFQNPEKNYELIADASRDAVITSNSEGKILLWNSSAEDIFGYRRDDAGDLSLANLFDEAGTASIKRELKALERIGNGGPALNSAVKLVDEEMVAIRKDRSTFPAVLSLSMRATPLGWVNLIVIRDISERKKAEIALAKAKDELEMKVKERTAELAESEEKYRKVVENANEVIVIAQDGIVKFLGGKAFELTGYSREEMVSRPFLNFVHPDDRNQAAETYRSYMTNDATPSTFEIRVVRRDGSVRWAQMNLAGITWGKRPAILAMFTDITQGKNLRDQLTEYAHKITRVQEEERKRIAFELHDDTAQYLAILKLQLDSIIHSGEIKSPKLLEKLEYLEKDAGRAVDDIRRYSHELRPGVLEHLGLLAALEQMAEDISKLNLFEIKVEVEGIEPALSEDVKLGFFRVAQEAINNIRKHAKASRATISLQFKDNQARMVVIDDGVGFDTQESASRSKGKGSLGLMSMQERANLIGASLKIESNPGQGTTIKVEMPL
jgi:PAS domain S-box-containing protein